MALLDGTLVLCVPKDISEAAISDEVRIITGVPVHDQRICRVSRRTSDWVRNERVLVLFRLRGGVAWNCIPLQDQTADFLRTNFWSLHASMSHPTPAQMTLSFEGVYDDPFRATLRSVSSSMLDNVKTEPAEVAVSSRPAPVRNPPAISSPTPASDSGPTESTDPAPLIKHEFSAAQSPRSDPEPHPDIPPRKRVKREAHCPSEHSPRRGDEVGCTFRSHTEAVAYLNKIRGELAIHNSVTSKSAGGSNRARIGCRIWGRLKQHGPLKETSRARPEKHPRPLTKSDLCPYGATLTHDPGTGLWKLTECNWDHSDHWWPDEEEAPPLDKSALLDELWHDIERAYEHREMPEQILVNLGKKYSEDAYPAIKGFSTQHIRNFFKSIERKMGPNDLARLINHLKMLKQADPAWYFNHEAPDPVTGVVRRWFFMTPEQVKNARKYAQVIFEDNTYKSNRYGEALALFCGINKHGQTLLLAQGCMPSSENAEDYEWLWQEWIKATGCAPRNLFSDAAYALLGSVPGVFPPDRTAHFLCLLHIYKNLTENCRNSLEQHDFTALESAIRQVQECPDKDAADTLWRKFLEDPRWKTVKDYLGVRSPLHRLDRWCVAWQVEVFTFGCKSTQRAESLNCRIKCHLTARKGYYHIFFSVLHLLSKEGYKPEYTEMVNHRQANPQKANRTLPFYVKFVSGKVTSWAFDRMLQQMNASTAYLVYEYDVSREAQYIVANRAAPLWNYDRQCHDSLETELVDLPRFCAISNRVHQIQGKNIVYEVKRSESSCTSRYMNCPHYVCLFEPLAEEGAYTKVLV